MNQQISIQPNPTGLHNNHKDGWTYWIVLHGLFIALISLQYIYGQRVPNRIFVWGITAIETAIYAICCLLRRRCPRFYLELPLVLTAMVVPCYLMFAFFVPNLTFVQEAGATIIVAIVATQFGSTFAEAVFEAFINNQQIRSGWKDDINSKITEFEKTRKPNKTEPDKNTKPIALAFSQLVAVLASFCLLLGKAIILGSKYAYFLYHYILYLRHSPRPPEPVSSQEWLSLCFPLMVIVLVVLITAALIVYWFFRTPPLSQSTFNAYIQLESISPRNISPPITSNLTWFRGVFILIYAILTIWDAKLSTLPTPGVTSSPQVSNLKSSFVTVASLAGRVSGTGIAEGL